MAHLAPDKLVGIEVAGIARRQPHLDAIGAVLERLAHLLRLVHRMAVHDHDDGAALDRQKVAQVFGEFVGVQTPRVEVVPERTAIGQRSYLVDRLALTVGGHYGRLPLAPPCALQRIIGADRRLVEPEDARAGALGARLDRRVALIEPLLDRLGVALVGTAHRLLRRHALAIE